MKLTVYVGDLKFVIPCGEGKQEFRWLGMVAGQRYALMIPHGHSRSREEVHAKLGLYLPVKIETMGNRSRLLPPFAHINQECKDGDEVLVVLQHEMQVDDTGTPLLTSWAIEAYFHTESTRSRYIKKISTFNCSSNRPSQITPSCLKSEKKKQEHQLPLDQLFATEEDRQLHLNRDWKRMKIQDILVSSREEEYTKDIVLDYFTIIEKVYQHYGIRACSEDYRMSLAELAHFIHECGVFNLDRDYKLIEKIFRQSQQSDEENSISFGLQRFEFLEALLRVAITQYKIAGDENMNKSEMVSRFMGNSLKPAAARLKSGSIKELVHSCSGKALFQQIKYKEKLSKVYMLYSNQQKVINDMENGTLEVKNLIEMIYDSGILSGGSCIENDDKIHNALEESCIITKTNKEKIIWPLVYSEFIEVISRISLIKWKDENMTFHEKIEITLDGICMLARRSKIRK